VWVSQAIKRATEHNETMKLQAQHKIEAVCSDDKFRPALHHPVLLTGPEKGMGRIMATDGRVGVSVPVFTGEHDTDGFISKDSLAMARKLVGKKGTMDISANGAEVIANGPTFPRIPDANLACFQAMEREYMGAEIERDLTVGVDVELLMSLCQALGTTKVKLSFAKVAPAEKAIQVTPTSDGGAGVGVIMPIRVS
jgi:hypothetical protein